MFKCEKCGGTSFRTIFWDAPRSGGFRVTCANCDSIIESEEYFEVK